MRLEDFNYDLPPDLIAQIPIVHRDASKLLVLDRRTRALEHRIFQDLPTYLKNGDLLVMNDTRVLPARLLGRRARTGGKVEVLLLREVSPGQWETLVKPGRRCLPGEELKFGQGQLRAEIINRTPKAEEL